MTLQELAKMCIALHVYSKDTEDTIMRVARLFEERSGVKQLEDIDQNALLRFKTETLNRAKTVTFNGYLRYLKLLGNFAEEEKIIQESPFKSQRAAPKTKAAPKIVEQKVFSKAFWYLARNPSEFKPSWFWKGVMKTIFYTGIRRRQIVSIKRKDINLETMTLRIAAEGSKNYREWFVPIHSKLKKVFLEIINKSEKSIGRQLQPDDYVFVIRRFNLRYAENELNPEQMKREQITGFFKRLSKSIDGRIGAHRLRHTTATTLCNPSIGSGDLAATQELLGHQEIGTTRIYIHPNLDRLRVAVNNLPDIENNRKLDNERIG